MENEEINGSPNGAETGVVRLHNFALRRVVRDNGTRAMRLETISGDWAVEWGEGTSMYLLMSGVSEGDADTLAYAFTPVYGICGVFDPGFTVTLYRELSAFYEGKAREMGIPPEDEEGKALGDVMLAARHELGEEAMRVTWPEGSEAADDPAAAGGAPGEDGESLPVDDGDAG